MFSRCDHHGRTLSGLTSIHPLSNEIAKYSTLPRQTIFAWWVPITSPITAMISIAWGLKAHTELELHEAHVPHANINVK